MWGVNCWLSNYPYPIKPDVARLPPVVWSLQKGWPGQSRIKQVGARVKLSGARWNLENVPRILHLRCAYINRSPFFLSVTIIDVLINPWIIQLLHKFILVKFCVLIYRGWFLCTMTSLVTKNDTSLSLFVLYFWCPNNGEHYLLSVTFLLLFQLFLTSILSFRSTDIFLSG